MGTYSIHQAGGQVRFVSWNAAGQNVYTNLYNIDNQNTSLAWIANGTTAFQYKNAVLINQNNKTAQTMSDTSSPLTIGASGAAGPLQYTDGLIDDTRIYSRALSASEISELYRMDTSSAVNTSGFLAVAP